MKTGLLAKITPAALKSAGQAWIAPFKPRGNVRSTRLDRPAAREVAAEGALKQAEAELAVTGISDASPAPVEVKANASGLVLHVFQESVRAVMQGTPLLEIGDPTDLEVVVEMLSRDGAAIAAGVFCDFLRQEFCGSNVQPSLRLKNAQ